MSTSRRLAAIMVADVVGYSRLMEADETATLAALRERRKSIVEPLVREHSGRIVKFLGDGVLVEFASAVNAVACGLAVQGRMSEANVAVPENLHIVLRIGINLGDVIGEGSDIYGDGVNIAARLESLAEPGGICISAKVHDELAGKVEFRAEDLGELALKNIAKPVKAFRLLTGARPEPAASAARPTMAEKPSIAILPFVNMSGDPEQEYFADGLTEDIITALSRFKNLMVTARNSSFHYKGKSPKIPDVGRELGVRFVLEGSVRKAGNRVRVTAQLIEAATGGHVWAERYDRDLADIFAVQDDLVRGIAGTVEGRVAAGIVETGRGKLTENMNAYDCVLRARQMLSTLDAVGAEPLLRRAVELDPNYAHALGWLAVAIRIKWVHNGGRHLLHEALAFAQRAVMLDESDAICHTAIGGAYINLREFTLAGIAFDRAVALNPTNAISLGQRAYWLVYVGRADEALANLEASLACDPFPMDWYWEVKGIALLQVRRYGEAADAFRRIKRVFWWINGYLAACFAQLGDMKQLEIAKAELLRTKPEKVSVMSLSKIFINETVAAPLTEGLHKAGF